ncbi:MAG: hypothetical protein JWN21_2644 [Sphingomonas bacterium]|uniref:DUF3572 domain-containing protein n=1 Tax=Sphingomonas bacterium TaxID=1895847 RepID=UPI0026105CDC|nr:DUF3572 domain-containing protein [Sphingomonas bacterium]MDB5697101.1 hypothetical protein [Sphingomonas bacterium]
MRQSDTNEDGSDDDAKTLALRALIWTLAEQDRAQRLLAVTGIEPADLRARIGDPAVLAASLNFLLANEADLVACAADIGIRPDALAAAAQELDA